MEGRQPGSRVDLEGGKSSKMIHDSRKDQGMGKGAYSNVDLKHKG